MLRVATLLTILSIGTPVLADTAQDCESRDASLAIRACTLLIQQNSRDEIAYFNRAIAYRAAGKLDLALADYNRVIEISPNNFAAYNNRGNIYMARRDNNRALQNFDQAVKINPKYAIAHNNRGEVLENMNRLDEAMAAYNRAIESNPRYARAFANRGDIWRKMGNQGNAIADYQHALSIDRNNSVALAGLKLLGVDANIATSTGPIDRPPAPTRPSSPTLPKATTERKSASTGTGFFVSQKGHVLTNHHVVENCSSIVVALEGTTSQSAQVTARDSKNDLALLRVTGLTPSNIPNLRFGVRLGESVFVYGFPLTGLLASTGNFTTGSVTAVAGLGDDTTLMQVSAPIQPGNSGGPVLDQHGNVVAVVVSKLNALRVAKATSDIPQNINFAIKSSIAMSFLDAGNVSPSATPSTTKLEAPQIAERARTFTVQIRCN